MDKEAILKGLCTAFMGIHAVASLGMGISPTFDKMSEQVFKEYNGEPISNMEAIDGSDKRFKIEELLSDSEVADKIETTEIEDVNDRIDESNNAEFTTDAESLEDDLQEMIDYYDEVDEHAESALDYSEALRDWDKKKYQPEDVDSEAPFF